MMKLFKPALFAAALALLMAPAMQAKAQGAIQPLGGLPADVALPELSPELQQQLNEALLGTPEQVEAKMATLIANNPAAAVALATNGASRNQSLAASFAGAAAKVVPAAQLGSLYSSVGAVAPAAVAQIATQIRSNAPPGTNLAALNVAVVQGIAPAAGPVAGPPPAVVPVVVVVVVQNENVNNSSQTTP